MVSADAAADAVELRFRSQTVDGRMTRAKDLLQLLELTPDRVDVLRRDTHFTGSMAAPTGGPAAQA